MYWPIREKTLEKTLERAHENSKVEEGHRLCTHRHSINGNWVKKGNTRLKAHFNSNIEVNNKTSKHTHIVSYLRLLLVQNESRTLMKTPQAVKINFRFKMNKIHVVWLVITTSSILFDILWPNEHTFPENISFI